MRERKEDALILRERRVTKDLVPDLRSGAFGSFGLFERTYGYFDIDGL